MSTEPKINEQFWFDMSYDMVKDSIERIKNGAKKIETLLLWAFGIYTASAIFTVEYKYINEIWILLFLSFPYLLLIIGYWFAHITQLPISKKIDYRSPTIIEEAYMESYKNAKVKLNISKWFSFAALLVLSICLMGAYVLKNQPLDQIYLDTKVENKDSTLYITGIFPKEEILKLCIISKFDNDSTSIYKESLLNSKTGIFQKSYFIDTLYQELKVEMFWSVNDYEYTILKNILNNTKNGNK